MEKRSSLSVLVVPSWYPSEESPTSGIFIAQQARALAAEGVAVAVIHVTSGLQPVAPTVTEEFGVLTVRACFSSPPPQTTWIRKKIAGVKYRSSRALNFLRLVDDCCAELEDRGFAPDVIHVQALWPAARIGARLARKYRVSMVVTEHSEEYVPESSLPLLRRFGMLPLVLRPLARKAAAYIAVSSFLAGILRALRLNDNIHVVPNVAPVAHPVSRPTATVQRIVSVSHLTGAKNIPLVLRAAAELATTRSDFIVDLVGDGGDRKEIEALVDELGISSIVEFSGLLSVQGVRDHIGEASFGVLSSNYETFSVFAAECLMVGRPVLTTACGGPADFVTDEVGRTIPVRDTDAMIAGISWMLDHAVDFNPDNLHEYAKSRFSSAAVVPQLVAIYNEVIDARA